MIAELFRDRVENHACEIHSSFPRFVFDHHVPDGHDVWEEGFDIVPLVWAERSYSFSLVVWSSGMILAVAVRGSEFDSWLSPSTVVPPFGCLSAFHVSTSSSGSSPSVPTFTIIQ